jgi:hypothetical protein
MPITSPSIRNESWGIEDDYTVVVLTVNYTNRRSEDEPFLQILSAFKGNRKSLGSGGRMVARLKLKRIDGRTHQEWSLRLNSQHGKTHQDRINDWE